MWLGDKRPFAPSREWGDGGPIIEREAFELHSWINHEEREWHAVRYKFGDTTAEREFEGFGPTPLVAAMRCYVASKMGNEIEVPDELM